jgi:hypothetical protein
MTFSAGGQSGTERRTTPENRDYDGPLDFPSCATGNGERSDLSSCPVRAVSAALVGAYSGHQQAAAILKEAIEQGRKEAASVSRPATETPRVLKTSSPAIFASIWAPSAGSHWWRTKAGQFALQKLGKARIVLAARVAY